MKFEVTFFSLLLFYGSFPSYIWAHWSNFTFITTLLIIIPSSLLILLLIAHAAMISYGKLIGAIPKEIGHLTSLTQLSLEFNRLTGMTSCPSLLRFQNN